MIRFVLIFFLLSVYFVSFTEPTIYSCDTTASCGCSLNSVSITRIVGGEVANISAWAWAVSLRIDNRYICGGSIISSKWILTAAHCLTSMNNTMITIFAGSNLLWSATQNQTTRRNIPHPQYNPENFTNDIALLELGIPLNLSDANVNTVCLPSLNVSSLETEEWPRANSTVVAVGWGRLNEGGSIPEELRQVTLNTMDYRSSMCFSVLNNQLYQFCAGIDGGGKDTCQGDSGGPLMIFNNKKQWVLAGITSNGIGCARPNYAGVYTRVAAYQDWIKSYVTDAHWIDVMSNTGILNGPVYSLFIFSFIFYLIEYF